MECRINAEDPFRGFLPSTGRLVKYVPPPAENGVRVDTGVYEGGEISMFYDSMIAKLIVHGLDRDQAIARMRDALNEFVIRGVASNISFQAALMQHPRFTSGNFNTGLIADQYPEGLQRRRRAARRSADAGGHRRRDPSPVPGAQRHHHRPDAGPRVQAGQRLRGAVQRRAHPATITPAEGGWDVELAGGSYAIRSTWQFGDILYRGTLNGQPICMQVERRGSVYRLFHWGVQADVQVMSARAADLLALMPVKAAPDTSKFLLSPMPGLLTQVAVRVGQEVKAGEVLAKIEAMKMENVLKAERDCVVDKLLAQPGESLAVDQAIIAFTAINSFHVAVAAVRPIRAALAGLRFVRRSKPAGP
jgi:propionyl-CoA carboxylase alpha chain